MRAICRERWCGLTVPLLLNSGNMRWPCSGVLMELLYRTWSGGNDALLRRQVAGSKRGY